MPELEAIVETGSDVAVHLVAEARTNGSEIAEIGLSRERLMVIP